MQYTSDPVRDAATHHADRDAADEHYWLLYDAEYAKLRQSGISAAEAMLDAARYAESGPECSFEI